MITVDIKPCVKMQEKQSGFISFNYDEHIINTIKSFPFWHYDVDTKIWEIPESKIIPFWEELKDSYEFEFFGELSPETDNLLPDNYKFKTKPFEHQLKGVEYGLEHDKWFLGDEQGLGKTFQVINIAVLRKLQYNYKHCLIVCGVNTLKWNWVNEIHEHSNEDAYILGQRRRKRSGALYISDTSAKIEDLKNIENLPYFIVTNVESFRNKDLAELVKKLCAKNIINMCALDEAHKCKNPQSQQTKGFFKCLPECRIAMTGTPIMNNPLDTYIILKWLGYESHAFGAFKSHYCIMGGFGGYDVVGYKNMNELQNKIHEIMLRRLKDEVFDLPEKVYIDEHIEMTTKQAQIYAEADSYIRQNIDLIASEPNPLSSLIRLRQATGYTGILSSVIQESAKLDRLIDIVEEAISNNRKVVIFSNWTQMTDVIFNELFDIANVLQITGNTPDNVRQQSVDEFQKGICNVLVGTIGAMGTGLTLTAGTVVIFMDHPWSRALYDQAVDRCHRIGQTQSITIYNLMCKDTIDEKIWALVNQKGFISDTIIDSKPLKNKTEILDFLLN